MIWAAPVSVGETVLAFVATKGFFAYMLSVEDVDFFGSYVHGVRILCGDGNDMIWWQPRRRQVINVRPNVELA